MSITNSQVAEVFAEYPPVFQKKLKKLRRLILDVSKNHPELGGVEETLKWGEPSYLPRKKNIGTTVRIHWLKSKPDQCGIYFNCNTTLIPRIKRKYGNLFKYEGKRAILFGPDDEIPTNEVKDCVTMALTYHLKKKM